MTPDRSVKTIPTCSNRRAACNRHTAPSRTSSFSGPGAEYLGTSTPGSGSESGTLTRLLPKRPGPLLVATAGTAYWAIACPLAKLPTVSASSGARLLIAWGIILSEAWGS
jgi:hypothetical protein